MAEIKLLSVLNKLDKKERKRLRAFIQSPYFGLREEAVRLLEILLQKKDEWEEKEWTDEDLFALLYPNQVYDKAKIHRARSFAFDVLEQFIIFESMQSQVIPQRFCLLEFYTERDFPKLYEGEEKTLRQLLGKEKKMSSDLQNWQLLLEYRNAIFQTKYTTREQISSLELWNEKVECFYVSKKLEYFSTLLNNKLIFNTQKTPHLLSEILSRVENEAFLQKVPVINVYYHSIQMLLHPEEYAYFSRFMQIMETESAHFMRVEVQNFYKYAINYCIRQINYGKKQFEIGLFEIYKALITNELILMESGNITTSSFKNVVASALKVNEIEWAKAFVEQYKNFLQAEEREDVSNYCLATLKFQQKEYKIVCRLLINIKPADVFFDLSARRLLMKTYYEMEEMELLNDGINRFRVFLTRNKLISEKHKKSNQNFAILISKLLNLPIQAQNKALDLSKTLAELNPIVEKNWLSAKIEELKVLKS